LSDASIGYQDLLIDLLGRGPDWPYSTGPNCPCENSPALDPEQETGAVALSGRESNQRRDS
jgi:hypothetical protein